MHWLRLRHDFLNYIIFYSYICRVTHMLLRAVEPFKRLHSRYDVKFQAASCSSEYGEGRGVDSQ